MLTEYEKEFLEKLGRGNIAMTYHLSPGAKKGARQALSKFWRAVHQAAVLSPFKRTPLDARGILHGGSVQ